MHDTTMVWLDPAWNPWRVPRVNKRPNLAQAAASVSFIERWIGWRRPTAFQRCLAIHILNTTESVNDAAPAIDAA